MRRVARSRRREPEGRRVCPFGMFAGSAALPPGKTARTGRLRVCRRLDPINGGVFGVLAPDATPPGALSNVPARIRGLEPEATLDIEGSGVCRSDAADREGRRERGIVRALRSLDGESGNGDTGECVVAEPAEGGRVGSVSVVFVLLWLPLRTLYSSIAPASRSSMRDAIGDSAIFDEGDLLVKDAPEGWEADRPFVLVEEKLGLLI
jgi:hypothetical protein